MILKPERPVLRYHGGKWVIAPWIISHFPQHRVYVEPYAGAASVLLRKPRAYSEVINDLDGEIVNLFRVLRSPAEAARLLHAINLTPFARAEFDAAYERSDDSVENARRLIVRAFMGHGNSGAHGRRTGFRCKNRNSGSTPAMDWRNWPAEIPAFVDRLSGVTIESRPALEVITDQDGPTTLHYVDPPYVDETRGDGHHRYRHEMTDADHRQLAATLRGLTGFVVLSGYPCALYDRDLFPDWTRIARDAMADGGLARTEVLWLSPRTADAMTGRQGSLFDAENEA